MRLALLSIKVFKSDSKVANICPKLKNSIVMTRI